MASLTKEILGHSMVQPFRLNASKGSFYLEGCNKQQLRICSDHTTKEVKNQTSSSTPSFIEAKSSRALVWKPEPVRETALVTVTATVTLKNSKNLENEMVSKMFQHFEAFNKTATEEGMVMQLVSTEVDPSEFLFFFPYDLYNYL